MAIVGVCAWSWNLVGNRSCFPSQPTGRWVNLIGSLENSRAATCLWRRSKNLCMVARSFRSCCCSRSHLVCTDSRNRHDFYSVINEHHQSSQRVMNAGDSALRPQAARTAVLTQGHSLARYRLNNVLGTSLSLNTLSADMPVSQWFTPCGGGDGSDPGTNSHTTAMNAPRMVSPFSCHRLALDSSSPERVTTMFLAEAT
jgi:hypothetical protein